MGERRNIVLITLDSLRADHCSFMGYKRKTTPTIDKMARKGLYFDNAIVASLPTPVSMYSAFTADYYLDFGEPLLTGLKKQFSRKRTIAEILKDKGYSTIAYNNNPYIPPEVGYGKGFSVVKSYSESKLNRILYTMLKGNHDMADLVLGTGISRSWQKDYKNFIRDLKSISRPYFLWILLLDTHIPYIPPKRHWSGFFSNYLINYKLYKNSWQGELDKKDQQKLIDAYDDCILNADRFINELMEDTEGDDPIFIIHADHGDGLGEHGFYHHPPHLYEELIHIPLVIYNSDYKDKIKNLVLLVSLQGLAPAILELIGEENEFSVESLLSGEDYVISKVFDEGKRKIALRLKNWKYIEGQRSRQLFNLKKDPLERENLVEDKPDIVKDFKSIITAHIKEEEERRKIKSKTGMN